MNLLQYKLDTWIPDAPDARDFICQVAPTTTRPKSHMIPDLPPVYDQGPVGSCVWNALAGSAEIKMAHQLKQHAAARTGRIVHATVEPWTPSRLFGYYNTRLIEGTVALDVGCRIRNGIKVGARFGMVPETEWPYDETRVTKRPRLACYAHARKHQIEKYERVPQVAPIMLNLLAADNPVAFGSQLYESFMSEKTRRTGVVPMPNTKTERPQGGHAMLAVGYDERRNVLIIRNSWSKKWGMDGYCEMPLDYVLSNLLSADLWAITWVELVGEISPMQRER